MVFEGTNLCVNGIGLKLFYLGHTSCLIEQIAHCEHYNNAIRMVLSEFLWEVAVQIPTT